MPASFVVENGSGVANANAYIMVDYFTDHHLSRGRDVSSILPADIEVAIVRGTDYIDQRFGRVYRGFRRSSDQSLGWPRLSAFDDSGFSLQDVPPQIKKATAEYALRAHILFELAPDAPRSAPSQDLSDPAAPVVGASQASGVIKSASDAVGPLKTAVAYASAAEIESLLRDRRAHSSGLVSGIYIPQYPTADMWLADVIEANDRRVVRG